LDPHNIGYLKSLADFYHAGLEQVEAALEVYEKIFELDATDVDCIFIAANLNVVLHNFDRAQMYYQKVLEIEPWHAEASEYLNKIKTHQASKFQPLTPDELYEQSQQAGSTGDVGTAISTLEQLVAQQPDHAIAHNDLGVYYQKTGELDKVGSHYTTALELEPMNITFEKNLADFQFAVVGDVTVALRHYLNVLKRYPEDTEVLMAAGHVCRTLDQPQDAELFFKRVLEIEPWNREASESLDKLNGERINKRVAELN
jgi:tetratricopeptide (TPR) repeat protein